MCSTPRKTIVSCSECWGKENAIQKKTGAGIFTTEHWTLLDFFPRRFLFMTRKIDYDDRNGLLLLTSFILYHGIFISKSYGPPKSSTFGEKEDQKCYDTKYKLLGLENAFVMTAVIILVIPLIIFDI